MKGVVDDGIGRGCSTIDGIGGIGIAHGDIINSNFVSLVIQDSGGMGDII